MAAEKKEERKNRGGKIQLIHHACTRPMLLWAAAQAAGAVCSWCTVKQAGIEGGIWWNAGVWTVFAVMALGLYFTARSDIGCAPFGYYRIGLCLLGTVFFFGAGLCRMHRQLHPTPLSAYLEEQPGAPVVQMEGTVKSVRIKDGRVTVCLRNCRCLADGLRKALGDAASERAMIVYGDKSLFPGMQVPEKGERLWVRGKCRLFTPAGNPGQFDFALHYLGQWVRAAVNAEAVRILPEQSERTAADRLAGALERRCRRGLERACTPEDAGILKAVLLGDRTEVPEDTRVLFQEGGISHLLAVSGLHVSLIGLTWFELLRKCGLQYGTAGLLAVLTLLLYGNIVGAAPSVVRAIAMLLVRIGALWFGRSYDLLSGAALALLWLVWDSPCLLFSAGLQLSFLAVLAIGIWQSDKRERGGRKNGIAAAFSLSVTIQIVTLPVILHWFFAVPLYAAFLNPAVVPLMSAALAFGLAAALTSWTPLAAPAHYIFLLYHQLCRWSASLPAHRLTPGRPALWAVAVYYGCLLAIFLLRQRTVCSEWRLLSARSPLRPVFLTLGLSVLFVRPVSGLSVTCIDVVRGMDCCSECGMDVCFPTAEAVRIRRWERCGCARCCCHRGSPVWMRQWSATEMKTISMAFDGCCSRMTLRWTR